MRWSKVKQLVEDQMASSLQRRVEIHTACYRKADAGIAYLFRDEGKREGRDRR